ncbi:31547_t:CDS:1 [Racocetra persica]|uniref:31547_t:CDS:1 n=1 Tax=Racocetra persica TaxID=160502 RepID=A0ACA9QVN9_9GLOM|nr:31547_t:CDS:1 [Racocetra persica]
MIRNFVLLFVFLAALSMVNAFPSQLVKRQASFGRCPGFHDILIITNVTLNPDPPKSNSQLEVKVSAKTNDDIVNGTLFNLEMFGETDGVFSNFTDICATIECPTKVFDFDKTYDLGGLPSSYGIKVAILYQSSFSACGYTHVQ